MPYTPPGTASRPDPLTRVRQITRRAVRTARAPGVPGAVKAALLRAAILRRVRSAEVEVPFPEGRVWLSAETLLNDYGVLYEMAVGQVYGRDFLDAVVIDAGGHRGYFGAWALHCGAREVWSFEPDATNFALLQRAAQDHRDPGRWRATRAAIGAREATVDLHVTDKPYSHSLFPRDDRTVTAVEQVPMVSLATVVAQVRAAHPDVRVILKADIEGGECELLLDSPVTALTAIDEVWVEFEGIGACARGDIEERLVTLGLRPVGATTRDVFHHRRR